MGFDIFHMSRRDRRWVSLAAGLLALWLQLLAPFSLLAGMQDGMAASAAADAVVYLCQPMVPDHGPADPAGKKPVRVDCQICQTLHLLANSLAPAAFVNQHPDLPLFAFQVDGEDSASISSISLGFSSRAPPIL